MLIDALNEEEPPRIRELMERLRPNAQLVCYGKVGAVVGHAHRSRDGRLRADRGVTSPASPPRFGGGRYQEPPPLPRLFFDPRLLERPLAELEGVEPVGRRGAWPPSASRPSAT